MRAPPRRPIGGQEREKLRLRGPCQPGAGQAAGVRYLLTESPDVRRAFVLCVTARGIHRPLDGKSRGGGLSRRCRRRSRLYRPVARSVVRRSRSTRIRMTWRAKDGVSATMNSKRLSSIGTSVQSVFAMALALRGALSIIAISPTRVRSEGHTSELQSLRHLVCRLLLEK